MNPFAIFAVISAISTAFSMYSAYQQGQAASRAAEYNAQVAENNRQLADQQARQVKTQAESEKEALRLQLARMRAQGRTAYAASGVQLGSGSHLDWEEDIAERAHYDLDRIDYNADLDAWGFRVQGVDYGNQARLQRMQASDAERAGFLGAGSSLLSGASSVASAYYMK